MRWWFVVAAAGCAGTETKSDDHSATGPSPACGLAEASQTCPSCTEGPLRCTFGETSVIEGSCGECQARHALYQQLCDDGSPAGAALIEAETVCTPVTCEVTYDCSCAPSCVPSDAAADPATTGTSTPCTCATPPTTLPGTCTWTGAECGFL